MFRELCDDTTLKNVVLVTNMWGAVSSGVGETRESELSSKSFKLALDKGAHMVRHYDTTRSAHDAVRVIMKNHPVTSQAQQLPLDEHKYIVDTAVGEVVNRELDEQMRRHQAEFKRVQECMMQALKEKDEEIRKRLEEEAKRLQEWMEKIKREGGVVTNHPAEREGMEARTMEVEQEARKERERIEAEYNQQLAVLNRRLQDVIDASATDRARLEQETRGRERAEKEFANLNRRLQDETDASLADRATLEQIRQRQVELENGETRQGLEEQARKVQNQVEMIEKNSKGMEAKMKVMEAEMKETEATMKDMEAKMKDMERERKMINKNSDEMEAKMKGREAKMKEDTMKYMEAKMERMERERERAEAEHKRQLADLTRDLQYVNEENRARIEREAVERRRAEEKFMMHLKELQQEFYETINRAMRR